MNLNPFLKAEPYFIICILSESPSSYVLQPESKRQQNRLRREDLERLTNQYLTEAEALGYSPAEVKNIVDEFIQFWNENGISPRDEQDTEK